jgi:ubiquinone/menaquinone biosynthesis C-methylase UbiE
MRLKSFNDSTRNYFQRVMDDWRPHMEVAHPYAENAAWQRNYIALQQWITDLKLDQRRVLEVGCGTGLLQHIVPNYVGTDLAATSAFYMHKPFCICSANFLPFADNSFEGLWTIWVLEHVEHPGAMLDEMRRVVKPGGSVFICAAYAVDSWISQGIHKRTFRELTPRQRLIKLTIPIRASAPYKIILTLLRRLIHLVMYQVRRQPTRLWYRRLQPNYEVYWDYDADACVSLDSYSLTLYFLSRGDKPYYPAGVGRSLLQRSQPQAYIIRK